MARNAAATLDAAVREAMEPVVRKASVQIARAVAAAAAERRARRVPTFVIEQTGLKTKKQIVAKYGENVAFEKGKPAPKAK